MVMVLIPGVEDDLFYLIKRDAECVCHPFAIGRLAFKQFPI